MSAIKYYDATTNTWKYANDIGGGGDDEQYDLVVSVVCPTTSAIDPSEWDIRVISGDPEDVYEKVYSGERQKVKVILYDFYAVETNITKNVVINPQTAAMNAWNGDLKVLAIGPMYFPLSMTYSTLPESILAGALVIRYDANRNSWEGYDCEI